jgi:soluble lytic murein transglycosylase-like protein
MLIGASMLRKVFLAAITAVTLVAQIISSSPAFAGDNWVIIRERSMRLKEAKRGIEAYQNAVAYQGSGENMVDREFVAGWIALRDLNRADIALAHFKGMTTYISGVRPERQNVAKAKAGYWLGRALEAIDRSSDAMVMYRASAAYSTTFYGQLSASEAKVQITRDRVRNAQNFPMKQLYWHDPKAQKELVLAVIREESRFQQKAESNKKARGMMQVMDGTAKSVGKNAGINVDVSLMRQSADYNIAVGSRYLADLLAQYNGNAMLAVSAYNAGPNNVDAWIARFGDPRSGAVDPVDWAENIPFKETREYAQKVIGSYITYLALNQ